MDNQSSPVELLRAAAAAQGVAVSDEDLAAVLGFLDRILPELVRLEAMLDVDDTPAAPEDPPRAGRSR